MALHIRRAAAFVRMPIARHATVADMTADSGRFRTRDQLIEAGFEPDCYPPCDWCLPNPTDPPLAIGNRIRPREGHPGSAWLLYEHPAARRQYDADSWEAICQRHWDATQPRCAECGEGLGPWCSECRGEYHAALFGDYPPPDDCGCAWHSLYLEWQPCQSRAPVPAPIRGTAPTRTAFTDGRLFA